MHILKPIYLLLLDIYLRINRDYKSPQKSIAGFLYFYPIFFSFFFFLKNTELEMVMVSHGGARHAVLALPTGAVFLSVSPFAATELHKVQISNKYFGWGWKKTKKQTTITIKKENATGSQTNASRRGSYRVATEICRASALLQPNLALRVSFLNPRQNFVQCSPENKVTKKLLQSA